MTSLVASSKGYFPAYSLRSMTSQLVGLLSIKHFLRTYSYAISVKIKAEWNGVIRNEFEFD